MTHNTHRFDDGVPLLSRFTQVVREPWQGMGRIGDNASMAGKAVNTYLVKDAANRLGHVVVQEIGYREDKDGNKGNNSENAD